MKFKVGDIINDNLTVDEVVEVNEDHYVLRFIRAIKIEYDGAPGTLDNYEFSSSLTKDYKLDKEYMKKKQFNEEMKELIGET